MPLSEKQKMIAGEPYTPDAEIFADYARAQALTRAYNQETDDTVARAALEELLAGVGEGVVIRPPFRCDYGYNIRIGDRVFMNFGCVLLDVCAIEIGAGTQIGPNVQIYAADHPRDPEQRRAALEFGRKVRIGRNVWIGGGAIVLPGVAVGDDAIIGAGSVVTRDVEPGATVAGNPARPIRR
jgi:maltose O-acetyltransferase